MRSSAGSMVRRLAVETRGAEIAEAAAVLPLMFMILLGIFWFGQAFSMFGTITRAAQEGARAGAAPSCTTCAPGNTPGLNAYNAVQAAMAAAKLDVSKAQYPSPVPGFNACNAGATVACDGASTNVCIQTQVRLSSTLGSATDVCGIAVSFKYPFQFKLPFTSLNNQQILLTAQARVRMETQ